MRYPLLLVCEPNVRLGEMLRELARSQQWAFRTRPQPAACVRLLRRGHPSVLVLRLGWPPQPRNSRRPGSRCVERALKLLERVSWLFPDTRTVVVNDFDDAALAALAWDLGAGYVLAALPARDQLPEIVIGMMKAAVRAQMPGVTGQESGIKDPDR